MNEGDRRWFRIARIHSERSDDPHHRTCCAIVKHDSLLALGCNELPRGCIARPERLERPAKYRYLEHAERNAIYDCARRGVSPLGATMLLPWYPCADCARAIVQSGISVVVGVEPDWDDPRWGADFRAAAAMLDEAQVVVTLVAAEETR